MDPKIGLIVVVIVIIVAILVMLSYSQSKKTCSGTMLEVSKGNISGSKTWLTPDPALGAPEPQMNHTEADKLRSPLYPMRQILDQLTLIEDHCAIRRRCYECLAKHMMTIEAWADFGNSLAGGATDDYGKIAQSVSDKLTEVRRLGMVKSRMGKWAKELYDKIREVYPDLDVDFNQLEDYEIQESKVPLLPLRLPHFNLREIVKLLLLMEVTTAHPNLRCLDCLRFFMTKAAALAKEGAEMSSALRAEYEQIQTDLNEKLVELLSVGITDETSQWFRSERKRLIEAYPELHEQGLYKFYEKPVYLAKCGETCS